MLKDPKASALVDNFAMQWLQLRRLETSAPDPGTFSTWDEELRRSQDVSRDAALQDYEAELRRRERQRSRDAEMKLELERRIREASEKGKAAADAAAMSGSPAPK